MAPRVTREVFLDAEGNEVDPTDPRAIAFEIETVDDETHEELRTYGTVEAPSVDR